MRQALLCQRWPPLAEHPPLERRPLLLSTSEAKPEAKCLVCRMPVASACYGAGVRGNSSPLLRAGLPLPACCASSAGMGRSFHTPPSPLALLTSPSQAHSDRQMTALGQWPSRIPLLCPFSLRDALPSNSGHAGLSRQARMGMLVAKSAAPL